MYTLTIKEYSSTYTDDGGHQTWQDTIDAIAFLASHQHPIVQHLTLIEQLFLDDEYTYHCTASQREVKEFMEWFESTKAFAGTITLNDGNIIGLIL